MCWGRRARLLRPVEGWTTEGALVLISRVVQDIGPVYEDLRPGDRRMRSLASAILAKDLEAIASHCCQLCSLLEDEVSGFAEAMFVTVGIEAAMAFAEPSEACTYAGLVSSGAISAHEWLSIDRCEPTIPPVMEEYSQWFWEVVEQG